MTQVKLSPKMKIVVMYPIKKTIPYLSKKIVEMKTEKMTKMMMMMMITRMKVVVLIIKKVNLTPIILVLMET